MIYYCSFKNIKVNRILLIVCNFITYVLERSLDEKKMFSAVFLDVAKGFDKVWHERLVYKKVNLPIQMSQLIKSHISQNVSSELSVVTIILI